MMNKYPTIFSSGKEVDLPAMLNARDERVHFQRALLGKTTKEDNYSLLVMTMAIPGPIKTNDILNKAFDYMVNHVKESKNDLAILHELKREEYTGYEYYILSSLSPREMKEFAVDIEETHPLGRLFDIDVLKLNDKNEIEGTSRTQLGLPIRRCFICNESAKDCGRSRRHSVEELQTEISQQILSYFE